MSTPVIVTGDSIAIALQLKRNGVNIAIDSGATIHAALVSVGHNESYTEAIEQDGSTAGADWDAGLVVVAFDPEDTEDIGFQGRALLEVQVDDGGPKTWFLPVQIVTGRIPANEAEPAP